MAYIQKIALTQEKFQEIYSNEKFRNQVACAYQCCDSQGDHISVSPLKIA